jgi:hypothetical protein
MHFTVPEFLGSSTPHSLPSCLPTITEVILAVSSVCNSLLSFIFSAMQLYGGIDRFLLQILVDGELNCWGWGRQRGGYDVGIAGSLEGLVTTTLIWTFLGGCDSRIAICRVCCSSSVMLYTLCSCSFFLQQFATQSEACASLREVVTAPCFSNYKFFYHQQQVHLSLSTQLQAFADTFSRLSTVPLYHKQQAQLFSAGGPSTNANVIRPNKHPRFPALASPSPPPCQTQGNRESEPTFRPQGSGLESRCSGDIGGYCVRPNFSAKYLL